MFTGAGISASSRFSVLPRPFPVLPVLLREFAGFNKLDESCGDDDVEDVDESPRSTRGTKFSVSHRIFFPSLVRCGF